MSVEGSSRPALSRIRQLIWLTVAVVAAVHLLRQGFDVFSLALIPTLVALGFAVQYVETRTVRPRRNYLRAALMSMVLGLVLVAAPLVMGSGFAVGLILWGGFSAAGFAWVHFYERTEPL
jgi:hypothetical protein